MPILQNRRGPQRRSPFPGDCKVKDRVFRLGTHKENDTVANLVTKPAPRPAQRVSPINYEVGSHDPEIEAVSIWSDLTWGIGLAEQFEGAMKDKKAFYLDNADTSTQVWTPGPSISTAALPSSVVSGTVNDPSFIFEFTRSGVQRLFCCKGSGVYIKSTVADTWTLDKDFSNQIKDVLPIINVQAGAINGGWVYFCFGGEAANKQLARLADDGTYGEAPTGSFTRFSAMQVVDTKFWGAGEGNALHILSMVNNPYSDATPGDWSISYVGDRGSTIVRMDVDSDGHLVIYKQDGMFTLDTNNLEVVLFPFLSQSVTPDNGLIAGAFEDKIYTQYNEGFFRFDTSFAMEPIGPENLVSTNQGIRGRITSFCAHATFNAYAWMYDGSKSYLMRFGSYAPSNELKEDVPKTAKHIDSWIGSLSTGISKKFMAMLKSSHVTAGQDTTKPRMYSLSTDGNMYWFTLPPAPSNIAAQPAGYTFSTADATVYLPRWWGLYKPELKRLHRIVVEGAVLPPTDPFTATTTCDVYYKVDDYPGFRLLGSAEIGNTPSTIIFPDNTIQKWAEFKIVMHTTGSVGPSIKTFTLYWDVFQQSNELHEMLLLVGPDIKMKNGTRQHFSSDNIHAYLQGLKASAATFTLTMPNGSTKTVRVYKFEEAAAWDYLDEAWRNSFSVTFMELLQNNNAAGSWANVELIPTWGDIEAKTWGEMEVI